MDKVLIVNADDLGRTPGINAGIFAAHEHGLVTSATLMVGFPAAEGAAAALEQHPELGVGLHVTLTGGRPILSPDLVVTLVDDGGRFPGRPEALTEVAAVEVRAEVEAQVERFRRLTGRLPTHLDSHHHSHRLPTVRDTLAGVARELGVPVRNASASVRAGLDATGVWTTDAFVESFYGSRTGLEDLLKILRTVEPGVTELMCHPARVDEALRRDSSYVDERERELETLTHPRGRQEITTQGIRLTHFGALCAS